MIEKYLNKVDTDFKYLKMYFEELKGAINRSNDNSVDAATVRLAKDKITYCINKIDSILGNE